MNKNAMTTQAIIMESNKSWISESRTILKLSTPSLNLLTHIKDFDHRKNFWPPLADGSGGLRVKAVPGRFIPRLVSEGILGYARVR